MLNRVLNAPLYVFISERPVFDKRIDSSSNTRKNRWKNRFIYTQNRNLKWELVKTKERSCRSTALFIKGNKSIKRLNFLEEVEKILNEMLKDIREKICKAQLLTPRRWDISKDSSIGKRHQRPFMG